MGFWGAQGGAIVDPKRQFRWLVTFGNSDLKSWYAKSVKKPSFQIGETPHQFINHTFYYPGRLTWNEITLNTELPTLETIENGLLPNETKWLLTFLNFEKGIVTSLSVLW